MDNLYFIQNKLSEKPPTRHLEQESMDLIEKVIELCKESGLSYRKINEALYTADRVQLFNLLNA